MTPKSRAAALYTNSFLANAPLFAIYTLLPFLLVKELGATGLQITVLISLKPLVAIFSTYWSALVQRPKQCLLGATIIGLVPTLLYPFYSNNWLFIMAFGCYFFAERAVIPTWMEILKQLPGKSFSGSTARGSLINFLAASILPVIVAPYFDAGAWPWSWIFCLCAILSFGRLIAISRLSPEYENPVVQSSSSALLMPWKSTYRLLVRRPDFALFQLIFLFGGLGIMVTQPALPHFVEKVLGLTYTELAIAIALCKGVGFILTNPFWSSWVRKVNLYLFSGVVTLFAAASLLLVVVSAHVHLAFYLAFICYGIMQAGSQLSWQMSGPIFAGAEESSPYTNANIMMVGLRGCIGPYAGGLVASFLGLSAVYILGTVLCLGGSMVGFLGSRRASSQGTGLPDMDSMNI